VPEIQRAHTVVSRMNQEVWQAERHVLEARIAALQASPAPADPELARREQQLRTDYGNLQAEMALKQREFEQTERRLRAAAAELQRELEQARSQRLSERERVLERLQSLRSRYEEQAARSAVAATTREQELTALLETKLLLKEILVSEPLRTSYPDLYEKTEKFLKAFAEALQREGQLAALRDLNAITASLGGDAPVEVDSGLLARYADAELRDLFYKLLDALRLMVSDSH
jgi:hypothetical protein